MAEKIRVLIAKILIKTPHEGVNGLRTLIGFMCFFSHLLVRRHQKHLQFVCGLLGRRSESNELELCEF